MTPREKALKALAVYVKRGYEAVDARAMVGPEGEDRFLAKLAEREAAFRNFCVYVTQLADCGGALASDTEAQKLLAEAKSQTATLEDLAREAMEASRAGIAKLDQGRNATRAYHSGAFAPRFIKGC